jgi:hypothetical protein
MSAFLVLLEISQWLGFNKIYFIIFKPIIFWMIFIMNNQINFLNEGLKRKTNWIMCSHLEKACLPCSLSMISFHIWVFKH